MFSKMKFVMYTLVLFLFLSLLTVIGLSGQQPPPATTNDTASATSLASTVVNLSASKNAYAQEGYPTTAGAGQRNLYLGYDTWYAKKRTRMYLQFDTSSIPANAIITSAEVRLYQYAVESSSSYSVKTYPVNCSWAWNSTSWNSQPCKDSSTAANTTFSTSLGWKTIGLTDLVKQWHSGAKTNNGVTIWANNEASMGGIFWSDACNPHCPNDERPRLRVEYEVSSTPTAPSDLTVGNATSNSLTLNWQDNSNNEDGFKIYRWDGDANAFLYYDSVGANATTFTDTSVLCGWDYFYEITAYNSDGESDHVGWVQGTVNACVPTLQVSPTSLSFIAVKGKENPETQSIAISNSGDGDLNWTASDNATWLSLDKTSGASPSTSNALANITGLDVGVYNGQITINANGVQGSPKVIPVTLTINQQSVTYQMTGRIANGLNTGIKNVQVSIGDKSATTDNDGNYTITGLENGAYNPSLSKDKYSFSNFPTTISIQNSDKVMNAIGHFTDSSVDSGFRPNPNGFSFVNQGYAYPNNSSSWTLFKQAFPATTLENSDGSRKQAADRFFRGRFLTNGANGHCRGFSHASLIHYAGLKILETKEDDVLSPPNDSVSQIYNMSYRSDSKRYLHM